MSRLTSQSTVAIVVPLLNEIKVLPALLAALCRLGADELIMVDGGSSDGSYQWLLNQGDDLTLVVCEQTGRAAQMNAGAKVATSDVLLFVHADTLLPEGAIDEVTKAMWGRFDLTFHDHRSRGFSSLDLVAWMINLRSRLSGVATGDQAIFVERRAFESVGGFESIPIMEDVALSKRLRRIARPYCSRIKVGTSARRWHQKGVWKTIFLMWRLRFAYSMGAPPEELHRVYRDVR